MTSRFICDWREELIAWAEARIPHCRFRDDAQAIGHERNGEIVASVVYDTFSTTSCFMHVASEGRKWNTREFMVVAAAYPFVQCRFPRVSAIVAATNRLSLVFVQHYGFKPEGVLREAGPGGEDIRLFGMLRRECRWLPPIPPTGNAVETAL
nr:N-acetyltransferase [Mesorhizobium sp.]